jgi:hypothetical protein
LPGSIYNTQTLGPSKFCANNLSPLLSAEGFWSLDRGTDCAVNDELGQHTNSTGDAKENGIVVGLG